MKNKVSPGTDCRQGAKRGHQTEILLSAEGKICLKVSGNQAKKVFSPMGAVDSLKSEHCFEHIEGPRVHSGMSGKQLLMCDFINI